MDSCPFPREGVGADVYEQIPFGVWLAEGDGGLRYASPSFLTLIGMSMDEARGDGWIRALGDENRDAVCRWKAAVARGEDWDDEHRLRDASGTTRILLARAHALRDEAGRVESWVGVHLDITERKRMEQEVDDARRFAEAVVASHPDPLLVLDEHQRVVAANAALLRSFRTSLADLVGRDLSELRGGRDCAELRRRLGEAEGRRNGFDGHEVTLRLPGLGPRVMRVSGRRIRQRAGRGAQILLSLSDVTEGRRAEERVLLLRESRATQQERERLAKRLHDHLQQLLVAADMQVRAAATAAAAAAQPALERARSAIRQAIDASRNLAVELSPAVLFDERLDHALHWLARWVERNYDLRLTVELAGELTLEDPDLRLIVFDVLRELVLNVVKHAQVDRATLSGRRLLDGGFELVVRDEGVGFDPRAQRVEDPAAGFGLPAARRSIEIVGGALEIDAAPGRGTRVRLVMPPI